MGKITTTYKIGLSAVLVLALMCAGYVFFYKHIDALREELLVVKKEIAVMDALALNKQETADLLLSTANERGALKNRFVSIQDPTPFLETIEASARDAGVLLEVKTLTIEDSEEEKVDGEDRKRVLTTLVVEGGWGGVYHLLALLEHIPYTATISRASLTFEEKTEGSVWEGQIQLQCDAQ